METAAFLAFVGLAHGVTFKISIQSEAVITEDCVWGEWVGYSV